MLRNALSSSIAGNQERISHVGVMINGTYDPNDPGPDTTAAGAYERSKSTLRNWITSEGPFPPDTGRYHLYVAWNCP